MPWRLPAWPDFTLPVPVRRKRFFAPDLVFILGILALLNEEGRHTRRPSETPASGSPFQPGGRREGFIPAAALYGKPLYRADRPKPGRPVCEALTLPTNKYSPATYFA